MMMMIRMKWSLQSIYWQYSVSWKLPMLLLLLLLLQIQLAGENNKIIRA